MRKDIFLHFLNRDTREIFGLYQSLSADVHRKLVRSALNVAVALCEDRCVAPPGFIVEDAIAFELAENQRSYLSDGVLQFPMRESSLAEFAEKKRIGYEPMRDRYSGLFSDTRIGFLGDNATGIIRRRSVITEGILRRWEGGPDSGSRLWKPIKATLSAKEVELVAKVPVDLDGRGSAVTWSAIAPHLPENMAGTSAPLRDVLQHVYFKQYCDEFGLVVLGEIPHILRDFQLPNDEAYSYRRFGAFLDALDIRSLIFDAPAALITSLRASIGFIAFIDAYVAAATAAKTETDLKFMAGQARNSVAYDWSSLQGRRASIFELQPLELAELGDLLSEYAAVISSQNGLSRRDDKSIEVRPKREKVVVNTEPELVLFVALGEELDVLASELNLKKNVHSPEATGSIGETSVAVVCPRSMGRVSAAIATARYLAARKERPKAILIVGIAGGFEENGSQEGHIVCASKAIDLAIRKVTDNDSGGASPNFRREDFRLSDDLSRVLQSSEFDAMQWSFDAASKFEWPPDRRPSIHYGTMASADEMT